MTSRQEKTLLVLAVASLTIALGVIAWWTFMPLAFASAWVLCRFFERVRPVAIASLSPALGWVLAALARDIYEGGRISAKLATLLHVQFAVVVYALVFVVVSGVSFFAAFSAAQVSKALR